MGCKIRERLQDFGLRNLKYKVVIYWKWERWWNNRDGERGVKIIRIFFNGNIKFEMSIKYLRTLGNMCLELM